jgi:hypothetical protein
VFQFADEGMVIPVQSQVTAPLPHGVGCAAPLRIWIGLAAVPLA